MDVDRTRRALETVLGVPFTTGNEVQVLKNGDEIFPAMLSAIDDAERTIDFLTFIYWSGEIGQEFAQHLAARSRAGVRVRVLLDAAGAWGLDEDILETMKDADCDVRWFRPIKSPAPVAANNRTHRKVLIVDETLSFTGGVGIADEWRGDARDEHEWRDTHFRVVGPAVDGLRAAFLDNWAETGRDLLHDDRDRFPDQPVAGDVRVQVIKGVAEAGNSDIWNLFRVLIDCADRCLRISTAYFTPDEEICRRLCEAAERGVQVQVLVPGPHADKRFVQLAVEANYERMLEAGIETYSFQPSMLHTKVFTVDGQLAAEGSANLNQRSTEYDDEVVMVIFDAELTGTLDRHMDEDLQRSERIDAERWEDRGLLQRAKEDVARAVDGLL